MDSQQTPTNVAYCIHTLFALCSNIAIYFAQIHMYKNRQELIYFGIL